MARLHARPLTYDQVGATKALLPTGYHHLRRSLLLPRTADFERAADDLLSWQVPLRAGLSVRASSWLVEAESVVALRLGIGRAALSIPCRVVYAERTTTRCRYAYGTLRGHPERGEESFDLERRPDGKVLFTVTAFSRPGTWLAQAGGPLGRSVQHTIAGRYLRALAD